MIDLRLGDCLAVLADLPDNSVDAVVTDPPYELGFMGKAWDSTGVAYDAGMWAQVLRVLKPGGHLLAFGGSRTYHRMACAIEDAGFEIRDQIMWIYGSGFPKSLNVAMSIDKAERGHPQGGSDPKKRGSGVIPQRNVFMQGGGNGGSVTGLTDQYGEYEVTSGEAKDWDGWGTALKPAHEPICMARKPLQGTVAQNALKWGTGAVNVDECRVEGGRFPANVIHDGSDEVTGMFPTVKTRGNTGDSVGTSGTGFVGGMNKSGVEYTHDDGVSGSAARFFYCAQFSSGELLFCRAKAIMMAWNPELANTVDSDTILPDDLVVSVLNDAVTVATHGGKLLSECAVPTMIVTPSALKHLAETLITTILISESEHSPGLSQGVLMQNGCLVSTATTRKQTDITTITISLPTSDGFAEGVMFVIMPRNTEHGVKDSRSKAFYCAKPSRAERDLGCEELPDIVSGMSNGAQMHGDGYDKGQDIGLNRVIARKNHHPTVKPVALMEYLVRLVTRDGATVLDPFMGSGTTGIACARTGRDFIGIEIDPDYLALAERRIAKAGEQLSLLGDDPV